MQLILLKLLHKLYYLNVKRLMDIKARLHVTQMVQLQQFMFTLFMFVLFTFEPHWLPLEDKHYCA